MLRCHPFDFPLPAGARDARRGRVARGADHQGNPDGRDVRAMRRCGNAGRHALVSMHPVTRGAAKEGIRVRQRIAARGPHGDRYVRLKRADGSKEKQMSSGRPCPSTFGCGNGCRRETEKNSGRSIAGPSIGHMAAADEAGGGSPVWPAKPPGGVPGRGSRRVPTPAARRCAARAPCRARGDQSQSR